MKKIILILVCVVCFYTAQTQASSDFQKNWSFGGMAGLTVGHSEIYESNNSNNFDAFGLNDTFNALPIMAVGEYRFNPKWSFRGALGVEIYNLGDDQTDIYYDDMPRVFPAAEALMLYHFKEEDKLFHPYVSMGLRFPAANVAVGLGNQFHFSGGNFFFLEAVANFLPTQEFRTGFQLGFLHRF